MNREESDYEEEQNEEQQSTPQSTSSDEDEEPNNDTEHDATDQQETDSERSHRRRSRGPTSQEVLDTLIDVVRSVNRGTSSSNTRRSNSNRTIPAGIYATQPNSNNLQQPLFGTQPQPTFHQLAAQSTFSNLSRPIFGNTIQPSFNNPSQGLFSNTAQPLFTNLTQPLFNNNSPSLFNNNSPSLFNNSSPSLFNNSSPSLFNNSPLSTNPFRQTRSYFVPQTHAIMGRMSRRQRAHPYNPLTRSPAPTNATQPNFGLNIARLSRVLERISNLTSAPPQSPLIRPANPRLNHLAATAGYVPADIDVAGTTAILQQSSTSVEPLLITDASRRILEERGSVEPAQGENTPTTTATTITGTTTTLTNTRRSLNAPDLNEAARHIVPEIEIEFVNPNPAERSSASPPTNNPTSPFNNDSYLANGLYTFTFSPFVEDFLRGGPGGQGGSGRERRQPPSASSAPRYTLRSVGSQILQERNLRAMRRELRSARQYLLRAYHYSNNPDQDNITLRSYLQDALSHIQSAQSPNFQSLIRLINRQRRHQS